MKLFTATLPTQRSPNSEYGKEPNAVIYSNPTYVVIAKFKVWKGAKCSPLQQPSLHRDRQIQSVEMSQMQFLTATLGRNVLLASPCKVAGNTYFYYYDYFIKKK